MVSVKPLLNIANSYILETCLSPDIVLYGRPGVIIIKIVAILLFLLLLLLVYAVFNLLSSI